MKVHEWYDSKDVQTSIACDCAAHEVSVTAAKDVSTTKHINDYVVSTQAIHNNETNIRIFRMAQCDWHTLHKTSVRFLLLNDACRTIARAHKSKRTISRMLAESNRLVHMALGSSQSGTRQYYAEHRLGKTSTNRTQASTSAKASPVDAQPMTETDRRKHPSGHSNTCVPKRRRQCDEGERNVGSKT